MRSEQALREAAGLEPVSYTHLDVYKRQPKADAIYFATLGFSAIISLLILFLRFLVLGQVFFFILQVEIIQNSGNLLSLLRFQYQEIDRRTTSGCKAANLIKL